MVKQQVRQAGWSGGNHRWCPLQREGCSCCHEGMDIVNGSWGGCSCSQVIKMGQMWPASEGRGGVVLMQQSTCHDVLTNRAHMDEKKETSSS